MATAKRKSEPTLVTDLRTAIRESGLTVAEIERRSGVDHASLSRFLRGQRSLGLPLAGRICELLGLRLCRTEEKVKPKKK